MPTFLIAALLLLGLLIAGLFIPAYLLRRRLDFRGQILDLLATAARRGIPFGPLLAQAAAEQRRASHRELLNALADAIHGGASLSRALASHASALFPNRVIAAVQASEGTAQLPALLMSLSHETTKALAARHQLSMSMFYPVCLGLFLIGLQTFYLDFAGAGYSALPASAHAPVSSSGVIMSQVAIAGVVATWLVIGFVLFYRFIGWRFDFFQRLVDALVRRLPILDNMARLAGAERLLRSTAALVGAGLSLPQALRRAAPATGNVRLAQAAVASAQLMDEGASADQAWSRTLLPTFAALRAATATGAPNDELAASLAALASECGYRLTAQADRCLRWIHPVTIGLFGLLLALQFAGVFELIYKFHDEAMLW